MIGSNPVNPSELEVGDEVAVESSDRVLYATLVDANPDDGLVFEGAAGQELQIAFADLGDYTFTPRGKTIQRLGNAKVIIDKKNNERTIGFKPPQVDSNPEFSIQDWTTISIGDNLRIQTATVTYVGFVEDIVPKSQMLDLKLSEGPEKHVTYEFSFELLGCSKITALGETAQMMIQAQDAADKPEITDEIESFFRLAEEYTNLPPVDSEVETTLYSKMFELSKGNPTLNEAILAIRNDRVKAKSEHAKEVAASK